jgi:hypothetical protein
MASGATRIALAGLAGEIDDVPGVAVPAGLAAGYQMVETGELRRCWTLRMACAVTSASSSAPVGAPIWSATT